MHCAGDDAFIEKDCCVVITPSHSGTAIQVHAVNLIEIRLEERWQPISHQS